jgi:uncharacterized protein YraI
MPAGSLIAKHGGPRFDMLETRCCQGDLAMKKMLAFAVCAVGLLALPTLVSAQRAFTSAPISLRTGPDGAYPRIGVLPAGQQVEIFGCVGDWSWCDVATAYDRGWVSAAYLDYDYGGQYIRVYGYGAQLGLPVITFAVGSYWDTHYRSRPWYGQRGRWEQFAPRRHPVAPLPRPIVRPQPRGPYYQAPARQVRPPSPPRRVNPGPGWSSPQGPGRPQPSRPAPQIPGNPGRQPARPQQVNPGPSRQPSRPAQAHPGQQQRGPNGPGRGQPDRPRGDGDGRPH